MPMNSPPNFWTLFAEALKLSASRRSARAFIPWWLIICTVIPLAGVYFLEPQLRAQLSDSNAITILSAVAVVGGFFGSVSIATMGHVQRMASEYPFSSYLKDENLFDLYLFWPQFILLMQLCLILISMCAALFIRLIDFDAWNKYIIAFDVGLLIYVCTKTWDLIELVRKLTWHYEHYNRLLAEEKQQLRNGD
jgi:hypothetical protein